MEEVADVEMATAASTKGQRWSALRKAPEVRRGVWPVGTVSCFQERAFVAGMLQGEMAEEQTPLLMVFRRGGDIDRSLSGP